MEELLKMIAKKMMESMILSEEDYIELMKQQPFSDFWGKSENGLSLIIKVK